MDKKIILLSFGVLNFGFLSVLLGEEVYVRSTTPPFIASDNAVYRTPTLAISSDGTILAFAGKRASHKDDSLIKVALRRSLDDGQNWETEQIIADGGDNVSASIACPVVIPASGSFSKERIMVLFLKNELVDKDARNGGRGLYKIVSRNNGKTWGKEKKIKFENVHKKLNLNAGEGSSSVSVKSPHEWSWYGIGPGHGVYLSRQNNENNGRIVFAARLTWDPQGIQESCKSTGNHDFSEYGLDQNGSRISGGEYGRCSTGDRRTRTHLIYSDPNEEGKYDKWFLGAIADEKSSEAAVEEASNGDLIVSARRTKSKRLIYISSDAGDTFSKNYTGPIDPDGCQASLLAAGENKEYILISNPHSEANTEQEDRVNGSLQIKNGEGWDYSVRYSDRTTAFSGYSDLAILNSSENKGDIGVLFERGGEEICESEGKKYSLIENKKLAVPFSSELLGKKQPYRWHMIDFKRIPLEVITEQSDDLIKQIEGIKRKNLSIMLRKKYRLPKACRKNKSNKSKKSKKKSKNKTRSFGS